MFLCIQIAFEISACQEALIRYGSKGLKGLGHSYDDNSLHVLGKRASILQGPYPGRAKLSGQVADATQVKAPFLILPPSP
jgi:hypothetical protein